MIKQQHSRMSTAVLRYVPSGAEDPQFVTLRSSRSSEGQQLYVIETPSFSWQLSPSAAPARARFEAKQDGYLFVTPGDCDSESSGHINGSLPATPVREAIRPLPADVLGGASRVVAAPDLEERRRRRLAHYCEERAKEMATTTRRRRAS